MHRCRKNKKSPPSKYSWGWKKAIQTLTKISSYKDNSHKGLQNILADSLNNAEEILLEYLKENAAAEIDTEFIDTVLKSYELNNQIGIITTLRNWKEQLKTEKFSFIENYVLGILKELLERDITAETTWDKTKHSSFKDWVLDEAIEDKIISLEKEQIDYLKNLPRLKEEIIKSPKHLIKLKLDNYYMEAGKLNTYLWGLAKITTNDRTTGILLPGTLVHLLKQKKAWPENVTDLGLILETDTQAILETALSLDLSDHKALEAARMLHK